MKQFNICVLGSANLDHFLVVSHIPQPGETLQALEQFTKNGGKGANQAVTSGKLNSKTVFLGQVGKNDSMALLQELNEANVNTEYLSKIDQPTGHAVILLDQQHQNSIIIVGGANMYYQNFQLPENYQNQIKQSKFLLLQKEIPMEINLQAVKFAKLNGVKTCLDCGGRDDVIPDELLQNLDFLSPNETELLRIIDNKNNLDQQLQCVIEKYQNLTILLKMGEKGCQIINKQQKLQVNAISNEQILKDYQIKDTTGAGDCFTSAFFVKLCELNEEQDLLQVYKQCMIFANTCAFLCITQKGAMNSMPLRKEVDDFMKKYQI